MGRKRTVATRLDTLEVGCSTAAHVMFSIQCIRKPIRKIIRIQFQFESVFPHLAVCTHMKTRRVFMIRLTVSEKHIVPAGKVGAISWEKLRIKSQKVRLNYSSFAHRL